MQQIFNHASLVAEVYPFGQQIGFDRIDWRRRIAVTTPSGWVSKATDIPSNEEQSLAFVYPAPVVLPEDILACEPTYPPQSFSSRKHLKGRNKVTCGKVIQSRARSYPRWPSGLARRVPRGAPFNPDCNIPYLTTFSNVSGPFIAALK